MKKLFFLLVLLSPLSGQAQDISGKWYGKADLGSAVLRIVFDLQQTDVGWSAKIQSPDQSEQWVNGTASVRSDTLAVFVPQWQFTYTGRIVSENEIEGRFSQFHNNPVLNLSRNENKLNRPQEPQPPFDYIIEEIKFRNEKAGIYLAGTLTIPDTGNAPYPAVILVTGSGPQDRDETLAGHKPFWVIADYLTRSGIAVLRYDDRGFGQSEGNFDPATTFDFTEDALAGIEFLRLRPEINPAKVGLAGHSEGGIVAFLAAAQHKTDFILSLAGPGLPGKEILARQIADISLAGGAPEFYVAAQDVMIREALDKVTTLENNAETKQKVAERFKGSPMEANTDQWYTSMTSLWMNTFLKLDPALYFPDIRCPVWAVIGEKDLQVSAKPNLEAIRQGLSHNPEVTVKEYPGLNHLFQGAQTGSPNEYQQIEETFNEEVLKDMAGWIWKITGKQDVGWIITQ